jgi:DNA-binding transcriptional LysR family regulator
LLRFNRLRPEIDVRIVASNDKPDLERDQQDIAIRFVAAGADSPNAEQLITCESFPVCSPALASDSARPLRTPADLAFHVRLDYESVRDGRRLSEWDFWFDAMKIRAVEPASTLRFPQFDQGIPAAIDGAGIVIGVMPHLTQQLRDGVLCAPFGRDAIANRGTFFIVPRHDAAGSDAVEAFVGWLRSEVRRDGELAHAPPRAANQSSGRQTQASGARTRARR